MRKFGIELETYRPMGVDAATVLINNGFDAIRASYSGRDYDKWQCKPDGSIHAPAGCSGVEIVSPVMDATEESYAAIENVALALKSNGFKVNRSCGFHVHISLADLNPIQRMAVMLRFALVQGEFNKIVPPSRVGNSYAQAFGRSEIDTLINRIHAGASWVPYGRYWTLNPTYLFQRGTLEFRQAAGTVEADKVVFWVKLLQQMIDEAVRVIRSGNGSAVPARAIRIQPGSDTAMIAQQLATVGYVSRGWLAQSGITHSRASSIVSWAMGRGARIGRGRRGGEILYRTESGQPTAWAELFASPTASDGSTMLNARTSMSYDFLAGVSADVREWVQVRRARFSTVAGHVTRVAQAEQVAAL